MIKIKDNNFSKEVKREIRKRDAREVVVWYLPKEKKLEIRFRETDELKDKAISTEIEIDGWCALVNYERIVIPMNAHDVVLDLILKDHYAECYKRNIKNITIGNNECVYYLSTLIVKNSKGKFGRIDQICFDGGDMFVGECYRYFDSDKTEEHYTPSATMGDYSPSNPWDAPGMSVSDFI